LINPISRRSRLDMITSQYEMDLREQGHLERAFWEFHEEHPEVYRTLVYFARQWRSRRGPESIVGIGALYERARWEMSFASLDDESSPRLSNSHRAFYARLIMHRNADLEGIFTLKRQRVPATFGPEDE